MAGLMSGKLLVSPRDVLRTAEQALRMITYKQMSISRGFALLIRPWPPADKYPKAEPDSDGAVVRAIGAIPVGETEAGSVSVALTFDGQLVGLVGTAGGGEAGGIKRQGQSPFNSVQTVKSHLARLP
jgi:hypothetical protein